MMISLLRIPNRDFVNVTVLAFTLAVLFICLDDVYTRYCYRYTIAELFFVKPGDKLKEEPDKLQCRVILVPDIWTLMPNESEWEQIKETYKQFGESKAMELEPPPPPSPEPTPDTTTTTSNDQEQEMLASASVNEQIFDKVMDSAEDQSNEMAEQADSSSSANEDKDTPQKAFKHYT